MGGPSRPAPAPAATEEVHSEVPSCGSTEVALAQALTHLCCLAREGKGRQPQRLTAAHGLLQACMAAGPEVEATAQAALRVLWSELKRLRKSVGRAGLLKDLLELQRCTLEHARVAHAMTLGKRVVRRQQKRSTEDSEVDRCGDQSTTASPSGKNTPFRKRLRVRSPGLPLDLTLGGEDSSNQAESRRCLEDTVPDGAASMEAEPLRDRGSEPGAVSPVEIDSTSASEEEERLLSQQSTSTAPGDFHECSGLEETVEGQPTTNQCPVAAPLLAPTPSIPAIARIKEAALPVSPPASLDELRKNCFAFRASGSAMHLCTQLCYFREFEAARRLRALEDRAAAAPASVPRARMRGITARLALSQQPPYWCVVMHRADGAVLGPPRQAWQELLHCSQPEEDKASSQEEDLTGRWSFNPEGSEAPCSPFGLIEELLAGNPWQLLATCFLLNKTPRAMVDRVLPDFLSLCPGPKEILQVMPEALHKTFAPLGLHRKRARMLRQFSLEYLAALEETQGGAIPTEQIRRMHGVGKYASDAYTMFVLGKVAEVQPTDVYLRWYREAVLASRCQDVGDNVCTESLVVSSRGQSEN